MKNWKRIVISPDTSIMDALKIIDAGAARIAFVTGKNHKLVGTVTDGDVRRGILKGIRMSESVEQIMNVRPKTVGTGDDAGTILSFMKKRKIYQMPVLDKNGCLIRVESLDELMGSNRRPNIVILMAGGLGLRLRPLTSRMPKPLIKVGDKPVLETALENLVEHGFHRFYFAVNYLDKKVRSHFGSGSRWDADIRYLQEDKKLGTAGALNLLKEKTSDPVLVMNADVLTKVNFSHLMDFHAEHESEATMCVREYDLQVPYGVVETDNLHQILEVNEKPVHRFFVNAGIYMLSPKIMKLIPKNKYFDMPQLFESVVKRKIKTAAFPIREYWVDIGRLDDLERARNEYKEVFQ